MVQLNFNSLDEFKEFICQAIDQAASTAQMQTEIVPDPQPIKEKKVIEKYRMQPKSELARISNLAYHYGVQFRKVKNMCEMLALAIVKNDHGNSCITRADTAVLVNFIQRKYNNFNDESQGQIFMDM